MHSSAGKERSSVSVHEVSHLLVRSIVTGVRSSVKAQCARNLRVTLKRQSTMCSYAGEELLSAGAHTVLRLPQVCSSASRLHSIALAEIDFHQIGNKTKKTQNTSFFFFFPFC